MGGILNANSCFVHIFRFSCFSMLLFWNSIFSAKQCLANAIRWWLLLFWNANVKSSDFLHRFYFGTETKTTNCQNDKMQKKKEKGSASFFYILGEEHTVSKLYYLPKKLFYQLFVYIFVPISAVCLLIFTSLFTFLIKTSAVCLHFWSKHHLFVYILDKNNIICLFTF